MEEEEEEDEGDDLVGGIDEDEGILANAIIDEDDEKWEDADQYVPELGSPLALAEPDTELLAPPAIAERNSSVASAPLTQEALMKKNAEDEEQVASEKAASEGKGKEKADVAQ